MLFHCFFSKSNLHMGWDCIKTEITDNIDIDPCDSVFPWFTHIFSWNFWDTNMKCFFAKTLRFFSFYVFFSLFWWSIAFFFMRDKKKNFEIGGNVVFGEFLTHCWFWMTDKLKNDGILFCTLHFCFLFSAFSHTRIHNSLIFTNTRRFEIDFFRCLYHPHTVFFAKRFKPACERHWIFSLLCFPPLRFWSQFLL